MTGRQILEALKMQPLSEEEKQQRHILGRLYGPIATSNSSTRNGRRYNKELWEKALADDVFKEKVANKSLFLELGHPADREETDMEKVCACIPEMPAIVDGDLYAYVDILDTNNGRLLKTLCDYGFVPGISSRGSGDVMPNDEVDPETFFLETWDIVQLPAVKNARLKMCESFDTKNQKLKTALTESLKKAEPAGKKIMTEALNNLHINLNEAKEEDPYADIPWATGEEPLEEAPEESSEDVEISDETAAEVPEEVEDTEVEPAEAAEDESEEEVFTVGSIIKDFENFDSDLAVEFAPIKIGDKEYPIDSFDIDDTITEGEVTIIINPVIEDTEEAPKEAEKEADEETDDEVSDAEFEQALESLKEALLEKTALEQQVKLLKNKQTVRDTEVTKIKEDLDRYKTAFARTSAIASTAKELTVKNKQLTEQLVTKDKEINTLKQTHSENLTESVEKTKAQIQSLKERLIKKSDELTEAENKLSEQANSYRKQLQEKVSLAKTYKARYDEILNEYVSYRASMLGVRPADITSKLNESYTIADVNKICDTILTEGVSTARLPYGINGGSRIAINESKTNKAPTRSNPDDGYDIDDSLLELAGLK